MKTTRSTQIIRFAVLALLCFPLYAGAWNRGEVKRFATLPDGAMHPEGVTVGPHGKIYVSTFFGGGTEGQIFVFSRNGKLVRQLTVAGSSPGLLDLAFHPMTGELLVLDLGGAQVLKVNPYNGMSDVFATIPGGAGAGPNVLTFDNVGNVYISDSFQGVIWRTDASGIGDAPGVPEKWVEDSLLMPNGVPPFGANGLAFNKHESAMFVANTSTDQIIKIPLPSGPSGAPGTPEVFVNSVNGADGLIIDKHDNLWIAANQEDEIVVVEPTEGRVIAKLGDFDGIDSHGRVKGLLFPATLVRHDKYIYVSNLALDLRGFGLAPPIDAPWAADVKKFTVSRLLARIPRMDDDHGRKDDDDDDDDDHGKKKSKHDDDDDD